MPQRTVLICCALACAYVCLSNLCSPVAIFTERINNLARHMVQHKKDHATKRGLQMLVSKRQRLLAYMKNHNFESFKRVVQELGLQAEAKRILD